MATSNAAHHRFLAAPSILPKYGGQLPPLPPPLYWRPWLPKVLQIFSIQPRISKVFLDHYTNFGPKLNLSWVCPVGCLSLAETANLDTLKSKKILSPLVHIEEMWIMKFLKNPSISKWYIDKRLLTINLVVRIAQKVQNNITFIRTDM